MDISRVWNNYPLLRYFEWKIQIRIDEIVLAIIDMRDTTVVAFEISHRGKDVDICLERAYAEYQKYLVEGGA